MNIIENIRFSEEKPAVLVLRKTEKIKVFAVGLQQNQLLKKHKASLPSMLTVLQGIIEFKIEEQTHRFKQFDTFQIPVNVEHEVIGLEVRNVFTILQEK